MVIEEISFFKLWDLYDALLFLDSVKNELDILIVKKLVRYDEIFS